MTHLLLLMLALGQVIVGGVLTGVNVVTTITAPTSSTTYDAGTSDTLTTLAGTAVSDSTITACTWTNSLGGSGTATGTTSWSAASIALTVGDNVITVTCTSRAGTTGQDVLTVTRSSPACTTTTADAEYSTVSAAVSAASEGDTICLPADTATWASTLTINKALTLTGESCSVDGDGRPTSCPVQITGSASTMVAISPSTPSSNPAIRLTNISLNCNNVVGYGVTWSTSSSPVMLTNIRTDHSIIKNCTSGGLSTGAVFGLADHNRFENNYVHVRCFSFGNESTTWLTWPASPGSATKPYVEDSTFVQSSASYAFISECGQGGSLVFRHNIIDISISTGFIEVFDYHGNQSVVPGSSRGTIEFETYNNTMALNAAVDRSNIRGGTGKFFNNAVTQSGATYTVKMTEYDNSATCASHYGFLSSPPGYDPVADLFLFNNTMNGSYDQPEWECENADPSDEDFIRLNQEYFEPSSGTAAARPATCTTNTYYGATDTGVISKCVQTDQWGTYYTPFTYPHPLQAASTQVETNLAISCSRTDVGNAVSAAGYDEIVWVPAGSCTWATTLALTKGIVFRGQGSGAVTITSSTGSSNYLLTYTPDATSRTNDDAFDLSGMTFNMNNASGGVNIVQVSTTVAMNNLLIHDNKFENTTGDGSGDLPCLRTSAFGGPNGGQVYGVVYNNRFEDCGSAVQAYGNDVASWNNFTYTPGGVDNLYFEDNTFTGNSAFHYGGLGGRYVARFNTYHLTVGGFQVTWDIHGNQPGDVCSTMGTEIYRNTVVHDRTTTVIDHRGGIAFMIENTLTGTAGTWQIRDEYSESECVDANPQTQYVSASYYVFNTENGSNVNPTESSDCCGNIAENAQYWLYQASFDGTVGTGRDTLAARPETCTVGVGYWATDQGSWNASGSDGVLYRCKSSPANTWEVVFTPYAYPHPLRGDS